MQQAIGAGALNRAAGFGLGVAFYACKLAAYLLTLRSPTLVRRVLGA